MKNRKISILALALVIFAASCKKTDLSNENAAPAAASTVAVATTNEWKSVKNWAGSKEDKFTSYSGQISDSSISAATAQKGLVLVFMKEGSDIKSLPLQANENLYWYYQISENSIQINADAYGASQSVNNTAAFKYFVLSAEKVAQLEAQGHSRSELMTLTYEAAATLIK